MFKLQPLVVVGCINKPPVPDLPEMLTSQLCQCPTRNQLLPGLEQALQGRGEPDTKHTVANTGSSSGT